MSLHFLKLSVLHFSAQARSKYLLDGHISLDIYVCLSVRHEHVSTYVVTLLFNVYKCMHHCCVCA